MFFEDMTLAELFAEADRIGDKYLSSEEIAKRDAELEEALMELREMIIPDPN